MTALFYAIKNEKNDDDPNDEEQKIKIAEMEDFQNKIDGFKNKNQDSPE